MFHMWAAMYPSMTWDRKDSELWTELVAQDQPIDGARSDSGHILMMGQEWVPVANRTTPRESPGKICWEYKALGKCFSSLCSNRHSCSICSSPHPSSTCGRAGSFKKGSHRRLPRSGGGPAPATGKGTHASSAGACIIRWA